MRGFFLPLLLACAVGAWAQNSAKPDGSAPPNSPRQDASAPAKPAQTGPAKQAPPQPDRVSVNDLGEAPGESSSKDTQLDLSPPEDDARAHPRSAETVADEEAASGGEVSEFHPWDPHRAAKDVEVGDFYFKRKNYRAAEDRYREALQYKDNDAIAIFRLAVCLEKMGRPNEALQQYENYLKILPHGPEAEGAKKAIGRLNGTAASAKPQK